jgi:hypothetical protein
MASGEERFGGFKVASRGAVVLRGAKYLLFQCRYFTCNTVVTLASAFPSVK